MATLNDLQKAAQNPNVQRFLDLVSFSEGTQGNGYQTAFGGGKLASLAAHPGAVATFTQTDGKKSQTTAAGRYQFLRRTWDGLSKQYGFKDFGQQSQDLGAIGLIAQAGALGDVVSGRFADAIDKTGRVWASFPSSPYPQGKKTWGQMAKAMSKSGGGGGSPVSNVQKPATKPEATNGLTDKIQQARSAGYSDAEIFAHLSQSADFTNRVAMARNAGYSDAEIGQKLGLNVGRPMPKQQQPAPQAKPEAPSALVRFGHGMNEALGGLYQGALYAKDAVTGGHSYDDYTAAQKAGEAIYQQGREANGQTGLDGWSLAGNITSTLPAGAAFKGMQGVGVLSKAGAQIMGRNALAGAAIAGAGLADDAKSRVGHMTAGAVLAPLAGVAMDKAASGIGKVAINRMARPAAGDAQAQAAAKAQAAAHVEVALKQAAGIPIAQINDAVKKGLVSDVTKMLQAGKTVDSKAIARKATLDSLRLKGTQAQVSGSPVEWQAEREMAKIQGVGDALRQKFVDDSEHLAQRLDQTARATLGTSGQDSHAAMQGVFDVLRANDAKRQDAVRSLYDQARNAIGNDLQLDAGRMVANLSQDLEHHGLGSFLKSDVKGMLGRFADGSEPLTLAKKEELVKIINARLASTTDGSQRYALGMVRRHLEAETEQSLDSVPVLLLQQGDLPAVQAWQSARQEAAKRFGVIDRTPAIQSALDDMAPDKAFEKLVLRADVRDLKALRNELSQNPQAIHDLRRQMVEHISSKAVNPNTGQFSPAAMRKALEAVGDRRLSVLFTPKQVARLKQIDAAANALMSEPRGAAVNHSNTGAALANHLARVAGLLGKVPVLGNTLSGAANLTVKMATKASAAGKAEKMAAGGLQASGRVVTPAMQEQLASLGLAVDAAGRIVRLTGSQTAGVSAAGH